MSLVRNSECTSQEMEKGLGMYYLLLKLFGVVYGKIYEF